MALMSGQVRVTVQMDGKGDAPRKVKETSDALDKTKQSSDATGDSIKGLADKMGGLKEGAGSAHKVKEAFENLKGVAGFVTAGVLGVGAAVVGLVDAFDRSGPVMEEWKKSQGEIPGILEQTKALIEETAIKLGNLKPPTDADAAYKKHQENAEKLDKAISDGNNAILKQREAFDRLQKGAGHIFDWMPFMQDMETELGRTINATNAAMAERVRLTESMRDTLGQGFAEDLAKVQINSWQMVPDSGPQKVATGIPDSLRERPDKKRGGGSKKDGWGEMIAQQKRYAGFAKDRIAINPDQALIDLVGEEGAKAIREAEKKIMANAPDDGENGKSSGAAAKIASDFDLATEAVRRFSEQMAPLLDETFPGLGTAVAGIDTIMQAYAATTEKTGKAAVQAALTGSTAVVGGIGRILGGKKGEWIAMSIAEGAAAAASFAIGDFWGGGQHLLSAGGYAAAAASAGGGGGRSSSRGGSAGGSRMTTRSTADRTASQAMPAVIIHGNWMGAASPQETAAEMRALQARGERSGYVPRGG